MRGKGKTYSLLDHAGDRSARYFNVSLSIPLFKFSICKNKANIDRYNAVTQNLKHITRHSDETEGIRVESLMGFTQVLLGVAGPHQIHGHNQKGSTVAPLARVEHWRLHSWPVLQSFSSRWRSPCICHE